MTEFAAPEFRVMPEFGAAAESLITQLETMPAKCIVVMKVVSSARNISSHFRTVSMR